MANGVRTPFYRDDPRRAFRDPSASAFLDRRGTVLALVVLGAAVFLLGLLAFVMFQTQVLFTDNARISEIRPGLAPRNDGGILFGASLVGIGTGLMLFALSPRRVRDRVAPGFLVATSAALLLYVHFTIFVNAFLIPRTRSAEVTASFLFNDTATAVPIAPFLLSLFTVFLILTAFLSGIALVAPKIWKERVLRPRTISEHRTRLVLLGLFLLGTGAAFARQFLAYALIGDSEPSGGFLTTNLTVVYYLLGFALIVALAVLAWRTHLLVWGDLRGTRSVNFRRSYSYLLTGETWLWVIILILNSVLLMAGAAFQPDGDADRVFAVNSKGVSIFFLLVAGLYLLHRRISRAHLHFLQAHEAPPKAIHWDSLRTLAVTVTGLWTFFALVLVTADITPLTKLLVRVSAVAVVLPFFAVRFDPEQLGRPLLRTPGSHYVVMAAATLSILAGIMLWGIGNSVLTRYAESGGFVTPDQTFLQPYATGVRVLGSLFLALPVTLALWFLATRYRPRIHPGPLLVTAFSIVIAMNLLLTINAADPRDVSVGRTDVLVGFSMIGLSTVFDKVILLGVWIATSAMGFLATALLVHHGVAPEARLGHAPKPRTA